MEIYEILNMKYEIWKYGKYEITFLDICQFLKI
jgi:hypothetical protein